MTHVEVAPAGAFDHCWAYRNEGAIIVSALGSHRFNPQTGLWELVSLENVSGVEMSLPKVAEVGLVLGLVSPDPVVPGLVVPIIEPHVEPTENAIPPRVIEEHDRPTIPGGPIHSVLEGGDGNDLVIAGASADHPENWVLRTLHYEDPTSAWSFELTYNLQDMHGNVGADRHNANGSLGDTLNGGLGQDTLIGNDLSNDLNGGAGADVMIGGGGEDIYWVDDAGDLVIESDRSGRDVVYSLVSYALSAHAEKLVLALGAGDINGTGNELNNILIGNEDRNVLSGGAGDDWLNGASGGDTLIGGEGRDVFAFGWSPFGSTQEASVVLDFEVGVDMIVLDLPNVFRDPFPTWVLGLWQLPAMRQEGADTIITLTEGENAVAQEIRLVGVDMHLLSQRDFEFVW